MDRSFGDFFAENNLEKIGKIEHEQTAIEKSKTNQKQIKIKSKEFKIKMKIKIKSRRGSAGFVLDV